MATKPCAYCGKLVDRPLWRLERAERVFCDYACRGKWVTEHRSGENSHAYKTGRHVCKKTGYVYANGVLEHRQVMEQHLGRKLARNEQVHHIDGNRSNNAIENLTIVMAAEHRRTHHPMSSWGKGGYERCSMCGTTSRRHQGDGLCHNCYTKTHKSLWGSGNLPPACVVCGTTDSPPQGRGECRRCYMREYHKATRGTP